MPARVVQLMEVVQLVKMRPARPRPSLQRIRLRRSPRPTCLIPSEQRQSKAWVAYPTNKAKEKQKGEGRVEGGGGGQR